MLSIGIKFKHIFCRSKLLLCTSKMTASSEDVLMQVNHVRYQKKNGTLYVMNERLAWIMENKDTVSVSHRYSEIKLQKISPEGKAKIQLQVVLHDGGASTFHFCHASGQAEQVKERDSVKDLLQQLLPKFKRKVNKELEEKNRQEIGVSGAFLADIKPQTDGCNGLKYNLTADIIESIFKTYPAVRKKHLEYVPHKIPESEFWTKFFQSHYFHRDRIHTGTKDLFTECAKLDDQEMKKDISAGINDPLVDITSFEDTNLDEGFGAAPDSSVTFNQHSFMVLKACQQSQNVPTVEEQQPSSAQAVKMNGHSSEATMHNSLEPHLKKKICFEDLEGESEAQTPQLSLTRVDRYLHGPMAGTSEQCDASSGAEMVAPDVIRRIGRAMQTPLGTSHQSPAALISPAQAINVLGELTPGGALMKGFQHDSLASMTPAEIEGDLRNLYLSLCELLRHFWACFPPTTPTLEEKATTMHETLHRFHAAKLKPFEVSLGLCYFV
ncbi:hypothetical protein B566_EDAN011455 [Ephemera danica]|nr:hypothetical protein B566_EDAN011455 [Ephemera danica]